MNHIFRKQKNGKEELFPLRCKSGLQKQLFYNKQIFTLNRRNMSRIFVTIDTHEVRKMVSTLFATFILFCCAATAGAQNVTVSGVITDESGETLIGVNIQVKGTTHGSITDLDGNYAIQVAGAQSVLVFSYVGYATQEITVGTQRTVNVTLRSDSQSLEEVVVVGYGTQKKVNMTGAVSSVDIAKLTESRPITALSAGLAGMVSGVFVTQGGGGRPGNDGATIRVRGQGTLNNSDPLVVIDGTVGNMNDVNPQDVESISVLKDAASSSIYGSRAANGVILITTRKGQGGTSKVTYNGYLSAESIPRKMDLVSNYADYMELINEGFTNSKLPARFSQGKIDEWRNAGNSNPLKYPNTDWQDDVFHTGWLQNHTLSVNGGSDKVRYFLSGNISSNPGIMENTGYDRITARANIETDAKEWLTVGINAYGYRGEYGIATNSNIADMWTYLYASTPGMVFRAPDGRYGGMNNPEDDPQSSANNPLYRLNNLKGDFNSNKMVSRFYGILKPFKGLSVEGSYTYDYSNTYRYQQPVFIDRWDFYNDVVQTSGTGRTSVTNREEKWYRHQADGVIRYETDVDRLNIQLMGGASQEMYRYQWFQASKQDLTAPELTELNATTADAAATGTYTNWVMRSYFGRLALNWDDKYLLEANVRADGSSRFARGSNRWGYFPSFSAGWRISEEGFLKDAGQLDNLKIRASWGALGNNSLGSNRDNDGNYSYQSLYAARNYILNNTVQIGFAQTALSNPNLTWETTYVSNAGIDFTVISKLSGTVDAFVKNTEGILIDLPAPLVHGTASIPRQNAAKVRNAGVELNLSWNDKIGAVNYFIGGNLSFIKNKVTKFKGEESSISGTNMIVEGEPINIQYLLSVDRIVQTDADLALVQAMVDNDPQAFAAYKRPEKGDFLYKDINKDGKINDLDRIKTGNGTNPVTSYGVSFGANWKGIDFSCLLQGVGGLKVHWGGGDGGAFLPAVRYGYQLNKTITDGRWYEGRTDAIYPRLLEYTDTRNTMASDFWIQDKSYMKVKNIQLGYTFPKPLTRKILMETLRFYASVDNALTFTSYQGLDPEVSGTQYPTMRMVTFGINLTF